MRNNSTTGTDAGDRQNLGSRYGEIGISAVTAALMCISGVKHRDPMPESKAGRIGGTGEENQLQHRRSARGEIDKIA